MNHYYYYYYHIIFSVVEWLQSAFNMSNATYEISHTLSVLSSHDIRVNLHFTLLRTTVIQRPYYLMPRLSNVCRCCPLPNLRNSNKLHQVQCVKFYLLTCVSTVWASFKEVDQPLFVLHILCCIALWSELHVLIGMLNLVHLLAVASN